MSVDSAVFLSLNSFASTLRHISKAESLSHNPLSARSRRHTVPHPHLDPPCFFSFPHKLVRAVDSHIIATMVLHQNSRGGSSTCVMEQPIELQDVSHYIQKPHDAKLADSNTSFQISETKDFQNNDPVETLPSPTTQAPEKHERWNTPRTNLYRTLAAFWSFVVMGSNDAAYGALIPYVLFPLPSHVTLSCFFGFQEKRIATNISTVTNLL